MKTIFSIIITILTFGCQEHEQLNTQYEILSGACGTLTFKDKIGNDINSASDSLEILQQELLTGGCPGNPCHNYNIEKRIIEVNFNKDRRDFYGFIFKDSTNNLSLFAMSDVLDTEGNYYFISWCSD
jgi:hypothetical protein